MVFKGHGPVARTYLLLQIILLGSFVVGAGQLLDTQIAMSCVLGTVPEGHGKRHCRKLSPTNCVV